MIFKFLLLSSLQLPSLYVEFDTVKLTIPGQQCGNAICYWLDRKQIESYNATKVIDTNIPKYIKFNCQEKGCWVKIYGPI